MFDKTSLYFDNDVYFRNDLVYAESDEDGRLDETQRKLDRFVYIFVISIVMYLYEFSRPPISTSIEI